MEKADYDRMTPDELRALADAKERAARPKEKRPTCQCFEHIRAKYKGVEGITYHDRVEVGKVTIDVVRYGPQVITLYGMQNHCCQCGAPFAEVDD